MQTRTTPTKQAVIAYLQSQHQPVSLNDIHRSVETAHPKTAFSTVFRIVQQLEQQGTVNRVDWRVRGSHYEWGERPHHHHIVCDGCGRVTDLDDHILNFDPHRIAAGTGYRVTHHTIELAGTCQDCTN